MCITLFLICLFSMSTNRIIPPKIIITLYYIAEPPNDSLQFYTTILVKSCFSFLVRLMLHFNLRKIKSQPENAQRVLLFLLMLHMPYMTSRGM